MGPRSRRLETYQRLVSGTEGLGLNLVSVSSPGVSVSRKKILCTYVLWSPDALPAWQGKRHCVCSDRNEVPKLKLKRGNSAKSRPYSQRHASDSGAEGGENNADAANAATVYGLSICVVAPAYIEVNGCDISWTFDNGQMRKIQAHMFTHNTRSITCPKTEGSQVRKR